MPRRPAAVGCRHGLQNGPGAIEALAERVQHGVFGYTMATDGYCEAVQSWFERRHGWRPEREWLVMTPGVVFALAVAINAFTQPGDHVIIQPPVYYPFRLMIQDNGRKMAASPLLYRDGRYTMDYEGFERQLEKTGAKLFILCNPAQPRRPRLDRRRAAPHRRHLPAPRRDGRGR